MFPLYMFSWRFENPNRRGGAPPVEADATNRILFGIRRRSIQDRDCSSLFFQEFVCLWGGALWDPNHLVKSWRSDFASIAGNSQHFTPHEARCSLAYMYRLFCACSIYLHQLHWELIGGFHLLPFFAMPRSTVVVLVYYMVPASVPSPLSPSLLK